MVLSYFLKTVYVSQYVSKFISTVSFYHSLSVMLVHSQYMHSFIRTGWKCQHFSEDSGQGFLKHIHLYQDYENCDYSLLLPWHRFEFTLFYPNTFLNLILEYNISSLLHFDWYHENVFLTNCKFYNLSI